MADKKNNDKRLSRILTEWYNYNKRALPWRDTHDPYIIWLSEVILQQTRVEQGYAYFVRFAERFPSVTDLADASEDEVLKLWQGLGYYSRARNLHHAAKTVRDKFGGVFPADFNDVLSLKGVGEYTAAAVSSFACNAPHAVVDGNVYRVLSRIFAIDTPIDTTQGKKTFSCVAGEVLDSDNAGLHNQAIMEFGALHCTPHAPRCSDCPVTFCVAYEQGRVKDYPVKKGKTKVRHRYFNYLDIRSADNKMHLSKRGANDIWQNLYELPLIETDERASFEQLSQSSAFNGLFGSFRIEHVKHIADFKHVLSHQVIQASFYRVEVPDFVGRSYVEIDQTDVDRFAVSRLTEKYLELEH